MPSFSLSPLRPSPAIESGLPWYNFVQSEIKNKYSQFEPLVKDGSAVDSLKWLGTLNEVHLNELLQRRNQIAGFRQRIGLTSLVFDSEFFESRADEIAVG